MSTALDDLLNDEVQKWNHHRHMTVAMDMWETLYGVPCGPYDERRAGNPMGLLDTVDTDDDYQQRVDDILRPERAIIADLFKL